MVSGAAQKAVEPALHGAQLGRTLTLEERVQWLFQVVETTEALLLEEIDGLRAQLASLVGVGGLEGDSSTSTAWQDVQVYRRERRLEQAAITMLLSTGGEHSASQDGEDALVSVQEATLVAVADSWSQGQDRRIAHLESQNGALAGHVQALDAVVAELHRRLDTISRAQHADNRRLEQELQSQLAEREAVDRAALIAASPPRPEDSKGQCLHTPRCYADSQQLRIKLDSVRRERDEQAETNAALRGTIAALRAANDRLLHRLHVKEQHLRQCCARISELWR